MGRQKNGAGKSRKEGERDKERCGQKQKRRRKRGKKRKTNVDATLWKEKKKRKRKKKEKNKGKECFSGFTSKEERNTFISPSNHFHKNTFPRRTERSQKVGQTNRRKHKYDFFHKVGQKVGGNTSTIFPKSWPKSRQKHK
jgi:hypothetical protein